MKTLEYRPGVQMSTEVLPGIEGGYFDLAEVRRILEEDESQVHCYLEPGDATRYELLLSPIFGDGTSRQRGLVLTRLRGGHVIAQADLWNWTTGASEYQIQVAARDLARGNDWTEKLLGWWLTLLCGEQE